MQEIVDDYEIVIFETLCEFVGHVVPKTTLRHFFESYLNYYKSFNIVPKFSDCAKTHSVFKDCIRETILEDRLKFVDEMFILYKKMTKVR